MRTELLEKSLLKELYLDTFVPLKFVVYPLDLLLNILSIRSVTAFMNGTVQLYTDWIIFWCYMAKFTNERLFIHTFRGYLLNHYGKFSKKLPKLLEEESFTRIRCRLRCCLNQLKTMSIQHRKVASLGLGTSQRPKASERK